MNIDPLFSYSRIVHEEFITFSQTVCYIVYYNVLRQMREYMLVDGLRLVNNDLMLHYDTFIQSLLVVKLLVVFSKHNYSCLPIFSLTLLLNSKHYSTSAYFLKEIHLAEWRFDYFKDIQAELQQVLTC